MPEYLPNPPVASTARRKSRIQKSYIHACFNFGLSGCNQMVGLFPPNCTSVIGDTAQIAASQYTKAPAQYDTEAGALAFH
ncbi:MAG: hypothetical protein V7K32_22715 [Nostoc sp.]|uniref:hypothetical protein n=1 Tax=Nostoc sp. TaxID=1180 RepID=UPI002FF8ED50